MPGNSGNLFYSFNAGPVHFVVFSTEFLIEPHPGLRVEQDEFLKTDLKAVNRSETPWVVTLAHRTFYCSVDWT